LAGCPEPAPHHLLGGLVLRRKVLIPLSSSVGVALPIPPLDAVEGGFILQRLEHRLVVVRLFLAVVSAAVPVGSRELVGAGDALEADFHEDHLLAVPFGERLHFRVVPAFPFLRQTPYFRLVFPNVAWVVGGNADVVHGIPPGDLRLLVGVIVLRAVRERAGIDFAHFADCLAPMPVVARVGSGGCHAAQFHAQAEQFHVLLLRDAREREEDRYLVVLEPAVAVIGIDVDAPLVVERVEVGHEGHLKADGVCVIDGGAQGVVRGGEPALADVRGPDVILFVGDVERDEVGVGCLEVPQRLPEGF